MIVAVKSLDAVFVTTKLVVAITLVVTIRLVVTIKPFVTIYFVDAIELNATI